LPALTFHVLRFSLPDFPVADSAARSDNFPMPLKILIAPDKFKGTLTAHQAAETIARRWCSTRP